MRLGTQELMIVLAIIVLLIGPTQIPKLVKLFNKGAKELEKNLDAIEENEKKQ